ncbi:hypothetical protein MUY14_21180 [Amycolatopsis sp. FBCC-B4732]|uniref:hypothetical protein n=1 Tax=Amycolatopsis sp. FBCC-B4732 TaxID=3079339 RepID=UPI001FF5252F|nr:hypothetical protein [Amycolatopsis sp. FBCC-B4732]UOX93008.1 hypothetical protein MUY14_21180 [Amycolatopsis sp. FBCC-B4732]
MTDTASAAAAAETIFAAAAELGTTRQEAILVTRAVHAVKRGRPTGVALTDTDQHRRRRLAHVVGMQLWRPDLDADAVLAAVTAAPPPARQPRSPANESSPPRELLPAG